MKRITSSIPPALSKLEAIAAMSAATGSSGLPSARAGTRRRGSLGTRSRHAGPRCRAVLKAGIESFASGPRPLSEALIAGAWAPSAWSDGVIDSASVVSRCAAGFSCRRNGGKSWRFCSIAFPCCAAARPDLADVLEEPAEVGPLCGQRGEDLVGLVGQAGEKAVLVGQHGDHLVGLLERRIGAEQRGVQFLTVAREADAEPRDDQLQPLLLGQPRDVGDQVDADRRCRVLERNHVFSRVRAGRDRRQRGRRSGPRGARLRGRALHELLAE